MRILVPARAAKSVGVCLVLGMMLALAGRASAQFGEAAGIAEAMQPDYYKRDVVLVSQGLKLDEAQRVILNTLYEDYQTAFDEGVARMKQRFDDMREELQVGDKARILKLVFAPFREWAGEKQQLGAQFLANVEVVLTEDQLQQWPAVQRRLYRERNLHKGRLSGESLNLLDVVRDMKLDPRITAQLQPVLDAYEISLDRALHMRDDPISGSNNPMLQSLEDQDPEKGQAALQKHLERQIEVRNVNDEYIERVAMALPEQLATEFRLAALDRAYPRIYRETPVQRMFKVARELQGLDAAVLESVIALESQFLAELAAINQTMLDALRKHEPADALERAADFAKRIAGQQIEPKPDPMREKFAKREELFRTYATRLHDLLTEDQFALLPGGYRWIETPASLQNADAPLTKDGKFISKPAKRESGFNKEN